MVEQLVAYGFPREKAEARARHEHGISSVAVEQQREADNARREQTIVNEADKQMRALGFRVISQSQPRHAKYLTPGIPDRLYFHRGRGLALYWEAKTATGEQSSSQKDFQEDCDACGWPYVLGTDQELYAWLIDHGIAARTVGDLLISLPYERQQECKTA